MVKRYKSRKISFIEYFENLQKEYIVSELRSKIYPNEKDKSYYREREMLGKRQRIEDISSRNNLENIFTSSSLKEKFYSQVYNRTGLPNFTYRDDSDMEKRGALDTYHYFAKETPVTIFYNECCWKGKVQGVHLKKREVSVYVVDLDKVLNVDFDQIARYDL